MAQAKIDLLRTGYAAFNRGEWDANPDEAIEVASQLC
jgi:hypothetical protein